MKTYKMKPFKWTEEGGVHKLKYMGLEFKIEYEVHDTPIGILKFYGMYHTDKHSDNESCGARSDLNEAKKDCERLAMDRAMEYFEL